VTLEASLLGTAFPKERFHDHLRVDHGAVIIVPLDAMRRHHRDEHGFLGARLFDQDVAGFTTLAPYLIDARNRAATEVLKEELHNGKKRIAIFYGAAHLPDLEQRLIRDFNMARTKTKWIPAWDLSRVLWKKDPLETIRKMIRSFQQPS